MKIKNMEKEIRIFQEMIKQGKAHPGDVDYYYSIVGGNNPDASFDEKVNTILDYAQTKTI